MKAFPFCFLYCVESFTYEHYILRNLRSPFNTLQNHVLLAIHLGLLRPCRNRPSIRWLYTIFYISNEWNHLSTHPYMNHHYNIIDNFMHIITYLALSQISWCRVLGKPDTSRWSPVFYTHRRHSWLEESRNGLPRKTLERRDRWQNFGLLSLRPYK